MSSHWRFYNNLRKPFETLDLSVISYKRTRPSFVKTATLYVAFLLFRGEECK